jgi:hypothetical protein
MSVEDRHIHREIAEYAAESDCAPRLSKAIAARRTRFMRVKTMSVNSVGHR